MKKINILDYKVEVSKCSLGQEGGYIAYIPEFDCYGDGETIEEAISDVQEVGKTIIELAIEDGREIPNPRLLKEVDEFSGKLTLRLPKFLHRKIAKRAEQEKCSINQLIQVYVSMGIGRDYGKGITLNINYNKEEQITEKINKELTDKWSGSTNKVIDIRGYA